MFGALYSGLVVRLSAGAASLLISTAALGGELLSGSVTTPDGAADQAAHCPAGAGYPKEWNWAGQIAARPVDATTGTPKIEQYRAGRLIATFHSFVDRPGCKFVGDGTDYLHPAAPAASGCGPFTREYSLRLWAPGDVFKVYPAIYSGPYNQPYFGPQWDDAADYNNGIFHNPDNVTVQGVVQNNTRPVIVLDGAASNNTLGQAPVYFSTGTGIVMDSIDVIAGVKPGAGKSGIYVDGAANLTLSHMRISGFAKIGVNGLFVTPDASGTLTLTGLELDHNGGPKGPAHNAYIDASVVDPNFTVVLTNSWSHDAYYGHLFKTRAQNGVFTGNLFQGGLPNAGRRQAEAYLLDVPNGGQITVRNNVFIKNASGANANGMSLTFLMEGATDTRAQSIDAENNTFVTFAKSYNGASLNYPFSFFYPNVRPDGAAWPASIPTRIIKNAFVGYCPPNNGSAQDYRGDISVIEGFAEVTGIYSLRTKFWADDAALAAAYSGYVPELGTLAHSSVLTAPGVRKKTTIGAQD
jgi:hypothetical protein